MAHSSTEKIITSISEKSIKSTIYSLVVTSLLLVGCGGYKEVKSFSKKEIIATTINNTVTGIFLFDLDSARRVITQLETSNQAVLPAIGTFVATEKCNSISPIDTLPTLSLFSCTTDEANSLYFIQANTK